MTRKAATRKASLMLWLREERQGTHLAWAKDGSNGDGQRRVSDKDGGKP